MDDCEAIEAALEVFGRAWAGPVLRVLLNGAERFSEIRRGVVGVTDAVLSTRLRELCDFGLVTRTVAAGPPVMVRYRLTDAGRDAEPVLAALAAFGRRRLGSNPGRKFTR